MFNQKELADIYALLNKAQISGQDAERVIELKSKILNIIKTMFPPVSSPITGTDESK